MIIDFVKVRNLDLDETHHSIHHPKHTWNDGLHDECRQGADSHFYKVYKGVESSPLVGTKLLHQCLAGPKWARQTNSGQIQPE